MCDEKKKPPEEKEPTRMFGSGGLLAQLEKAFQDKAYDRFLCCAPKPEIPHVFYTEDSLGRRVAHFRDPLDAYTKKDFEECKKRLQESVKGYSIADLLQRDGLQPFRPAFIPFWETENPELESRQGSRVKIHIKRKNIKFNFKN